jgi:class 3 adenylate cyclase
VVCGRAYWRCLRHAAWVSAAAAPSGVVTFLFTDVEDSTRRWEADADGMRTALAAHDEVLRGAIEAHGGWVFKHTGDGVCAPHSPRPALRSMRRWPRNGRWSCRCGWALRQARPSCVGGLLRRGADGTPFGRYP